MATLDEKRAQAASQCRVIVHLSCILAKLHADLQEMYALECHDEGFIDFVGKRSAERMELLGDILNGMDAADPSDKWMDPIFKRGQAFWPTP